MKVVLDLAPIAQIRMKYSGRNGVGRIYDPRSGDKKRITKEIKDFIRNNYPDFKYLEHPRVSFVYHTPIPKSTPKRLLPLYMSGLLKDERKPDVDNLAKIYMDCMNGIVYEDDRKVMFGPAVKLYHPYPKTLIILQESEALLSPFEVDPGTWYALFGKESCRQSYSEMVALPDLYTPQVLTDELYPGKMYPLSVIQSYGPQPLVPMVLEQARQACKLSRLSVPVLSQPAA